MSQCQGHKGGVEWYTIGLGFLEISQNTSVGKIRQIAKEQRRGLEDVKIKLNIKEVYIILGKHTVHNTRYNMQHIYNIHKTFDPGKT